MLDLTSCVWGQSCLADDPRTWWAWGGGAYVRRPAEGDAPAGCGTDHLEDGKTTDRDARRTADKREDTLMQFFVTNLDRDGHLKRR